jgi:hypothetical protein
MLVDVELEVLREHEQVVQHPVHLAERALDRDGVGPHLLAGAGGVAEEAGVDADHAELLEDLVRDDGRHLADRREPLAMLELAVAGGSRRRPP